MFSNMLLFVLIWNRTLGSGVWAGWRIVQWCGVVARVFRRLAAVTEKSLRHSWQCAAAWVVWSGAGVLDLRVLLPAGVPHRHSAELRMQTRHLQHGEAVCTSCMSNSKSVCMCVCSPFWFTAVGQFFFRPGPYFACILSEWSGWDFCRGITQCQSPVRVAARFYNCDIFVRCSLCCILYGMNITGGPMKKHNSSWSCMS